MQIINPLPTFILFPVIQSFLILLPTCDVIFKCHMSTTWILTPTFGIEGRVIFVPDILSMDYRCYCKKLRIP